MAGRNNAVNLTGMLSQMNDAISGFGEAGNQYVDTFRRSMAPKPDMNDSKSLLEYAEWARRNGYDEEARQYLALGQRQKEKEVQEAKDAALGKTMAEATQTSSTGLDLGAKGDLGGADATIAVLNKRLSDPEIQKNPRAVEAIQREIASLQSQRPDFEAKNVQAIAQGVAKMDQNIAALNQDDPDYAIKKANFEAARSRFLDQPGVEEAYEGNKLKLMELNNQKMDAMWKAQSPAIIAEMSAAGTDVKGLEAIEDKYPQFVPQIVAVKGQMVEQAERLAEVRDKAFRVEQLPSRIERDLQEIEESTLSEEQKKFARDLLAGASNAVAGGSEYKDSAISAYEKAMTQINQMRGNELAAQAGVERQRTERAVVAHEKSMQTQVSLADAVELAELKYGDNPSEDEIKQAQMELEDQLNDYRYRTAIAAGKESPQELDADDKRVLNEKLKNGDYGEIHDVAVMRATYDLVSQGYRKEDVVSFLKKELPKQYADSAEQIYNDMWADLENQDAQTASPAEVKANPYRREPGFRWLDRAVETIDARYQGFLQRRSQTMATQPRPEGPSVADRQRAKLSPPLGPLGTQGDTKLRDARKSQAPNGNYPYPGEPVSLRQQPLAADYIYPGYNRLGG